MMHWSRPEIYDVLRDLYRHISNVLEINRKAMHAAMTSCVENINRGWNIEPKRKWVGKDKSFEFVISRNNNSYLANARKQE